MFQNYKTWMKQHLPNNGSNSEKNIALIFIGYSYVNKQVYTFLVVASLLRTWNLETCWKNNQISKKWPLYEDKLTKNDSIS